MGRWGVTPKKEVVQDLSTVIGKRAVTNLSPTFRARLLYYDEKWGYFRVEKNHSKSKGLNWGRYNHCAGQIIEIPTKLLPSMHWLTKKGQR